MCELFAMSSSRPTALTYSFEEFSKNGSKLRSNRDGWGIALARDRDVMLVKEPKPAVNSIWVRFIAENAIETHAAIAHVRHATQGRRKLENTHPFRRTLGGRTHVFAHNGTMDHIYESTDPGKLAYGPIGETDSELAFCILLTRLSALYENNDLPTAESRFDVFAEFCADMKTLGTCNFLFFDGEILFGHGHKRVYEEDGQLTEPKSPGLQIKKCWKCAGQQEVHGPGLDLELADQQTVLLASVPLDVQGWEPLAEGAAVALKDGEVILQG